MHFANVCEKAFRISTAVLLVSAFLASAQTPQRTLLPGHLPAVVPSLQPLDRLNGSTRLKLSINLPLHNREALTNLLDQLYDPASPLYHHYLAPEEFDARFGPTEQDYQAVIAWAARSGFTVNARHPNRMLLEVSASVKDIERALQVTMRTYAQPTEPRTFFAPDTEPSAGVGIPILYIGGLDNFARPHPKNLRRSPLKVSAKPAPQIIGTGPNGNLAGFDYRAAYAPGVPLTGTGQSVGLVEFDGYYAGDIASYVSQTGVSNVPLQNILLDGFNGVPGSGNSEVALDTLTAGGGATSVSLALNPAANLLPTGVYTNRPAFISPVRRCAASSCESRSTPMFFRLPNCGVDLAQQQVKMLINVLESRMGRRLDGMGASKAIRPVHPFKVFSTGAVIREHTLSISEDSSGILTSPSKRLKAKFWICQTTG